MRAKSFAASLCAMLLFGQAAASAQDAGGLPAADPEAEAMVSQMLRAYDARDLRRFVSFFSADAVVEFEGHMFTGRSEIARAYRLNFAPGAPRTRIVEREAYANRVIDQEEYTINGQTFCCSTTAYVVEDGEVVYANVVAN